MAYPHPAPSGHGRSGGLGSAAVSRGVAINLSGLCKRFGPIEVLHGVDLQVRSGEFVAVVGRSGCGKSTLLRLLAGLETPTQGCLEIDGAAVQGLSSHTRVLFQTPRLLPWRRVMRNVGLGLRGDWQERARAALRAVGLESRQDDWPSVLSGGQRQRVALARALVAEPRLMLLDEPLGALDALTRLDMQMLVETVWREQGFTAILVTHDVGEAVALADRVVLIESGAITLDERIELPRPRARGTAGFAAYEGRVLARIMGTSPPART